MKSGVEVYLRRHYRFYIMNKKILYILIAIVLMALSFFIGRREGKKSRVSDDVIKVDTLYRIDTIVHYKPNATYSWIDEEHKVVVLPDIIFFDDTTFVHDTLYLPLERKVYEGEDYRAVVSGYQPSLDEIAVFPKTTVITRDITTPAMPWKVNVSAGLMTSLSASPMIIPSIGVSVGYQKKRYGLGVEVGYLGDFRAGAAVGTPYLRISADLNLFSF